jgi:hypothetical protein
MLRVLEVFGAAAFGACLGATLAWLVSKRRTQVQTAFDMHHEYFDSLVASRESAVRFIRDHPQGDLAQLWRSVSPAEMEPLWQIVYFYERLWVALKHHYINPKLVPELFGDSFNYWYQECFERQLVPVNDPTARHIADLRSRLLKRARAADVEVWEKYRKVWQLESSDARRIGP